MSSLRIELLQQMPIFGGATPETLRFLLADTPSVEVAAGAYFFRENDPASSMFVLERGRVSVLKRWNDHELPLGEFGPGDCFGEMALLDLAPRSASVLAREDCRAIPLSAGDLYRLLKHDATQFALIQMNIAREMSRRLRAMDALLFRFRMEDAKNQAPVKPRPT